MLENDPVAFWTMLVFVATAFLALIAWLQIWSVREENRKTLTLQACGQYDTNEIIFRCHKALIDAKGSKAQDDAALLEKAVSLRIEILTVLNFLDAIAIGINQKIYAEKLARAHIKPIMRKHVAELIDSGVLEILDCPREGFAALIAIDNKWKN
jgi:hypothetical protein